MIETLDHNQIPSLLLKGAALLVTCHESVANRWMADVDILVPYESRHAAVDVLADAGWPPRGTPDFRADKHGVAMANERGMEMDLHWHVSSDFVRLGSAATTDQDFWEGAQTIELAGRQTRALCPADQLLHVIVHGHKWGAGNRLQWIADATLLIESQLDLQWERLIEQARKRSAALVTTDALSYLDEVLAVPVPSGVLEALSAIQTSPQARLAYWLDSRPAPWQRPLKVARRALGQYLYLTADMSPQGAVAALPAVLADRWDVSSPREMLGGIGSKSVAAFRERNNG